jgi:hypothetical protein
MDNPDQMTFVLDVGQFRAVLTVPEPGAFDLDFWGEPLSVDPGTYADWCAECAAQLHAEDDHNMYDPYELVDALLGNFFKVTSGQ